MALKNWVASLEEVDEDDRDKYEETDRGFELKAEHRESGGGGGGHRREDDDDYAELKGALRKEREENRRKSKQLADLQKRVESIEGLGDPDELAELKRQHEEAQQRELERKGEWDKLRAQMHEQHQKELDKERKRVEAYKQRLDTEIRGRAVAEAISKHQGNPNLLKPILMSNTRLSGDIDGENDDLRVEILEGGTPLVDAEGNPLSIDGYVKRLREQEDFAGAFKGTGNSGGGSGGDRTIEPGANGKPAGGGQPNGGGIPPELANLTRSQMTPRQKIDIQKSLTEKHDGDQDAALTEFLQIPY